METVKTRNMHLVVIVVLTLGLVHGSVVPDDVLPSCSSTSEGGSTEHCPSAAADFVEDGSHLLQRTRIPRPAPAQVHRHIQPGDGGMDPALLQEKTKGDECQDSANGAVDPYGTGCSYYDGATNECNVAAYYDNDFTQSTMCCSCGGGHRGPPTPAPTPAPTTAPTPAPTRAPGALVVNGHSGNSELQPECLDKAATTFQTPASEFTGTGAYPGRVMGTSCCTKSGKGFRPDCKKGQTFQEAKAWCKSKGSELCSAAELAKGVTRGKGCSFDKTMEWSSDECAQTPAPTPAPNFPKSTAPLPELKPTELHLKIKFTHRVIWDYGGGGDAKTPDAHGLYGWSYYLRAFNLVQDTPVKELGWGQWSSPGWEGSRHVNKSICPIHPHVCKKCQSPQTATYIQDYMAQHADADMRLEERGMITACTDSPINLKGQTGFDIKTYTDVSLEGCGGTNYKDLEKCKACDSDPMPYTVEGGMGYWPYMTEDVHVSWMMPASTASLYAMKETGGSLLPTERNSCTEMGGAVRVANRIVLPYESVDFEGGNDIDGFLGYMLARTPIGKRSDDDDANYWTISVDTANFAGPLVYMSTWFWDARSMWHPNSMSWSDPRALMGYIAEGFEGSIGGYSEKINGGKERIFKSNRWGLPLDKENTPGMPGPGTTIYTGHKQYKTDWMTDALEPFLDGSKGDDLVGKADEIRQASEQAGEVPQCNKNNDQYGVELKDQDTAGQDIKYHGWAIGASHGSAPDTSALLAAGCPLRVPIDTSHPSLDCDTKANFCVAASPYLKQGADGSNVPIQIPELPQEAQEKFLHERHFDTSPRQIDGRHFEPWDTERACFDKPGPATDTLYCTRTQKKTWIAWKWYRFVDQPDLNQVFASIPDAAERQKARCFMQARIERLHKLQEQGQRWFEPPQGDDNLPADKVEIDKSLLVTPPEGLEYGYVPIPIYTRYRMKPKNCLKENTLPGTQGTSGDEPEPHPDVHRRRRTDNDQRRRRYYSTNQMNHYPYDQEICRATGEEANPGEIITKYGEIYPYPVGGSKAEKVPYKMPLRTQVSDGIDANPPMCDGTVLQKSTTTTTTVCPAGDYPSDGGPRGESEEEWEDLVSGIKSGWSSCDGSPKSLAFGK